jgi:hypothetical protein
LSPRLALALALLVSSPLSAAAAPALLKPARVLRPEAGYFEEALALDPDGRRLAVVRTDGATFSRLDLFDLTTGKVTSSLNLGATRNVEQVHLLAPGKGVVLIAHEPQSEQLVAVQIDEGGKLVGKAGPAMAFAIAEVAGETAFVAMDKKVAMRDGLPGETAYSVTALRGAGLAPIGKPRLTSVSAEGELRDPDAKKAAGAVRMVAFFDAFTRILGERAGGYDRKKDFRRPSRMVVLDALTGKVASESEIEDVFGWALTTKLRAEHPNRTVFAQLNQDQTGLDLITPAGKKVPLGLAAPFRLYDQTSLHDQEGEGSEKGTYYFSLAIDPVNPDAIARKKADKPQLDLYAADVRRGSCTLRGRILLPRPVSWKAGYGRLVVLKRFKSFTRGGDELELYDLP